MDIGDSFAAPYTSPEEMHRLRGRFTSVCRTYVNQQAKLGATVAFTIRNVADKKEVRVWKVAPKLPTAEEVSQALA
jgi:uroporphyrinogen-III decarboxylase